jgi:hypothetical protein
VTIVRVGTNKKFADGWEAAFGKGKSAATKGSAKAKGAAKKSTKKKAAKSKR